MAASSLLAQATRFLAVVLVAGSLAACANDQNQQTSQLTGKDGSVTPGTHRDFSVNVGDIVYFTTDSSELTPEATATLQKQAVWLQQYPQYTITIAGRVSTTSRWAPAAPPRCATSSPRTASTARACARSPMARSARSRFATTSPAGRRIGARRRC